MLSNNLRAAFGGGGHANAASTNNINNNNKLEEAEEEEEEGLSACLLVNDENPRLPEWIAYHYHILPLRSLTITVDPASRSSPKEILDRWQDMDMGLDVQLWDEDRYMPYGAEGACDPTSEVSSTNTTSFAQLVYWRHFV